MDFMFLLVLIWEHAILEKNWGKITPETETFWCEKILKKLEFGVASIYLDKTIFLTWAFNKFQLLPPSPFVYESPPSSTHGFTPSSGLHLLRDCWPQD